MKRTVLIIFLIFISISLFAQSQSYNKEMSLGEEYYKKFSYYIAINHFEKAYNADSTNAEVVLRLAQCNYKMRDFKTAQIWASRYVDLVPENELATNIYYYVEILAANRKYDEAAYWFGRYMQRQDTDEFEINRMKGFLQIKSFKDNSKSFRITPVSFNSDQSDFAVSYFGDSLVFVSGRRPGIDIKRVFKNDHVDFLNLYLVKKEGQNKYSEPKKFSSKVKTRFHEGPVAFFDTTKIIFSQSGLKGRHWFGDRMKRSKNGSLNQELYIADYVDGEIKNITEFPYNNPEFTTAHPTISDDGTKLIFASDRADGQGKSDLYICYKAGNTWGAPINLGDKINTEGSELFPKLVGEILYFSSDGHQGLGEMDVFKTVLINDKPTEIINLGYPINSNTDDFAFNSLDGHTGYFSSNRGGENNDDIYYFEYYKPIPPHVSVAAVDSVNGEFIMDPDVYIVTTDSMQLNILPLRITGDSIYDFIVDSVGNYDVTVQKPGYITAHETRNLNDTNFWVIPLTRIIPGQTIKLRNIYYDFDKETLRDSSRIELNLLVKWMKENPNVRIKLISHTDSRGNDKYNLKLSDRRSKSVVKYLTDSGIEDYRLESEGKGETEPVYSCPKPEDCTKEQHQANRRTEFEILDNKESLID